tara:strand:- start:551 stop:748 length:198 start_codon:yes stop_codon:yes gene_type:complete
MNRTKAPKAKKRIGFKDIKSLTVVNEIKDYAILGAEAPLAENSATAPTSFPSINLEISGQVFWIY